jgi:hypothetical protein
VTCAEQLVEYLANTNPPLALCIDEFDIQMRAHVPLCFGPALNSTLLVRVKDSKVEADDIMRYQHKHKHEHCIVSKHKLGDRACLCRCGCFELTRADVVRCYTCGTAHKACDHESAPMTLARVQETIILDALQTAAVASENSKRANEKVGILLTNLSSLHSQLSRVLAACDHHPDHLAGVAAVCFYRAAVNVLVQVVAATMRLLTRECRPTTGHERDVVNPFRGTLTMAELTGTLMTFTVFASNVCVLPGLGFAD